MPKLLENKYGHYLVDDWENVLTYRMVTSYAEMKYYQGSGISFGMKLIWYLKKLDIPDDFIQIGVDEEDTKLGFAQTVRWAKRGHYWYILKMSD